MSLTSYCERCGKVGFHSEACIAATSAERIAFKQAGEGFIGVSEWEGIHFHARANEHWIGVKAYCPICAALAATEGIER